jgi:RHS repeat-associated protein
VALHPDGLVAALLDDGGERATYDYDADSNLTHALEATGLIQTGQTPLPVELSYDSRDQQSKVRVPKPGSSNWLATVYSYDLHGNRASEEANREETSGGSTVTAGRVSTFAYDNLDRATSQVDDFATGGTTDDEQLLYTYTDRSELATQTLQKGGTGAWSTEQSSARTYFDNGLLKTLTNKNAAGAMIEQHTLGYVTGGVFVNGNRVSDTFQLKGPDAAASCYAATCTATWTFDARDRLTAENTGAGLSTTFTVDVAGNVTTETPSPGAAITRTYSGLRLATQAQSGTPVKFLYDGYGNQDCKVKSTYAGSTCPGSGSDLLEDWSYDYKNRLMTYRSYNDSGGIVTTVSWTNDPLDRPVAQSSTVSGSTTNYAFSYLGASDRLSQATLTGTTSATRKYLFDALGQRATMTDNANRYSYQHDPHGSVSLLVDQTGAPKASYGYTAYGTAVTNLTKAAAGFSLVVNAYRYTGKRLDADSNTLDMGARRFSRSTGRFLQLDQYNNAINNLGLARSPLTNNRYALAAGNPITYREIDGHYIARDTTANGIISGAPPKSSTAQVAVPGHPSGGQPEEGIGGPVDPSRPGVSGRSSEGTAGGYETLGLISPIVRWIKRDGVCIAVYTSVPAAGLIGLPDCLPNLGSTDNGCGPGDWREKFAVPDAPLGVDIREACRTHDECYATIGATKRACDKQLGFDVTATCLKDIIQMVLSPLGPFKCPALGAAYAAGVAKFGQQSWTDAQAAANERARIVARLGGRPT